MTNRAPDWKSVPLAKPNYTPYWPLPSITPKFSKNSFGGGRPWGCEECERWHCGVDLINSGDAFVTVPEECEVYKTDVGWSGQAKAIYLISNNYFIVMGGIENNSPQEYEIYNGSIVSPGDTIGVVNKGYGMIHFELYDKNVRKHSPWYVGNKPPKGLLNPTEYIVLASGEPIDLSEEKTIENDGGNNTARNIGIAGIIGMGMYLLVNR